MKIIKFIPFIALLLMIACQKESIPRGQISESLWLEHKGAQMPILVEGNIASKTLILILHGGPGGTAKTYNSSLLGMSEPLEQRYAVAYYDQRLAGNTKGHYDAVTHNVAQMVEDLDLVIDLLNHQYGSDLNIFLLGHSWGGYLGNAYLSRENNQTKIKGWIDVDGAHNIEKLVYDGITLMQEVAEAQIADDSREREDWQKVMNYVNDFKEQRANNTFILDKEITLEMNGEAGTALNIAQRDELLEAKTVESSAIGAPFFRDNNFLTNISHSVQVGKSNIWNEILAAPLTNDLKKITIPSLMIWGKYDFVVAPSLGEEMMQELGTPDADKTLLIFDKSGHSPMISETDKFIEVTVNFIEQYR